MHAPSWPRNPRAWPWWKKDASCAAATACSMSAVASMMRGLLPPAAARTHAHARKTLWVVQQQAAGARAKRSRPGMRKGRELVGPPRTSPGAPNPPRARTQLEGAGLDVRRSRLRHEAPGLGGPRKSELRRGRGEAHGPWLSEGRSRQLPAGLLAANPHVHAQHRSPTRVLGGHTLTHTHTPCRRRGGSRAPRPRPRPIPSVC